MRNRRFANQTETSLYHCNSHRNRIPQYEIFTRTFFFPKSAHIQQCGDIYLKGAFLFSIAYFLIHLLALYNVIFQCKHKNIFRKFLKISFAHKKLKKPPEKVAYLWQLGGFFLCSPDCPKQPRTSFPFHKFFYTTSSRVGSLMQC